MTIFSSYVKLPEGKRCFSPSKFVVFPRLHKVATRALQPQGCLAAAGPKLRRWMAYHGSKSHRKTADGFSLFTDSKH